MPHDNVYTCCVHVLLRDVHARTSGHVAMGNILNRYKHIVSCIIHVLQQSCVLSVIHALHIK